MEFTAIASLCGLPTALNFRVNLLEFCVGRTAAGYLQRTKTRSLFTG